MRTAWAERPQARAAEGALLGEHRLRAGRVEPLLEVQRVAARRVPAASWAPAAPATWGAAARLVNKTPLHRSTPSRDGLPSLQTEVLSPDALYEPYSHRSSWLRATHARERSRQEIASLTLFLRFRELRATYAGERSQRTGPM